MPLVRGGGGGVGGLQGGQAGAGTRGPPRHPAASALAGPRSKRIIVYWRLVPSLGL